MLMLHRQSYEHPQKDQEILISSKDIHRFEYVFQGIQHKKKQLEIYFSNILNNSNLFYYSEDDEMFVQQ